MLVWGKRKFFAVLDDVVEPTSDTLGRVVDERIRSAQVLSSKVEGLAEETVITLDGADVLVREIRPIAGGGRVSRLWYVPAE